MDIWTETKEIILTLVIAIMVSITVPSGKNKAQAHEISLTPPRKPVKELDTIKNSLIAEEGFRTKVYKDTHGNRTIGVGFNLEKSSAKTELKSVGVRYKDVISGKQELSEEQVYKLLNISIFKALDEVKTLIPNFEILSPIRQNALVGLTFQLGKADLAGFKNMLKAINIGDWQTASKELLVNSKGSGPSLYYKQTPERAKRYSNMLLKGN